MIWNNTIERRKKKWMNRSEHNTNALSLLVDYLYGRRTCFDATDVLCISFAGEWCAIVYMAYAASKVYVFFSSFNPERICDVTDFTCAPVPVACLAVLARSHWTCSIISNALFNSVSVQCLARCFTVFCPPIDDAGMFYLHRRSSAVLCNQTMCIDRLSTYVCVCLFVFMRCNVMQCRER